MKIEHNLNPQQLEAATTFDGPLLCIAGAGTGKTKTLVYRVAFMIDSGIPAEQILLLTFTRKAATNMLTRVAELTGSSSAKVNGGTYHGFATKILRTYATHMALPSNFIIIDHADVGEIINILRSESEQEYQNSSSRFPRKNTIIDIFSTSTSLNLSIPEVIEKFFPHFAEHSKSMQTLFKRFSEYKAFNGLVDYEDLLVKFYELLSSSLAIREEINASYSYVMCDEYQDTNLLQAKISLLLAGQKQNIMVVGDDSQSIYSFRGAVIKNIIDFPKQFEKCTIIRLEQNYRSTKPLLDATNNLMLQAKKTFKKTLFTEQTNGNKPAIIKCSNEEEQATFVVSKILNLLNTGVPLKEIAILFRSGFHTFQLELELKKQRLPFVKWGGFKFLESAHLKDFIAFLRIIYNRHDRIGWLRILQLTKGIGSTTASNITQHIVSTTGPLSFCDLKLNSKIKTPLKDLSVFFNTTSAKQDRKPGVLIDLVTQYYYPFLKEKFDDYPRRLKDIDQLSIIADRFESLKDFLEELALEPPTNSHQDQLAADTTRNDSLVLSTIHSAKGLQWHSVFIITALEGRFPTFAAAKNLDSIEEERRLMYVAMTRARQNLFISYPSDVWDPVTSSVLSEPSRFIKEIDPKLFENWYLAKL